MERRSFSASIRGFPPDARGGGSVLVFAASAASPGVLAKIAAEARPAFTWRRVSTVSYTHLDVYKRQIQLTKRQDVVPMTRDYVLREEQRLFAAEGKRRPPLRLAGE